MKTIITQVSEVGINGVQTVAFDILDKNDNVLISTSVSGDVEQLVDQVKMVAEDYETKIKSAKRLKVGDVIN